MRYRAALIVSLLISLAGLPSNLLAEDKAIPRNDDLKAFFREPTQDELMAYGRNDPPGAAPHQDKAIYNEYVLGLPFSPNECEHPLRDTFYVGSTLEACEEWYSNNNFIKLECEKEALLKQSTAPHLLKDADVKWLSNVANRKKACMDLLARKGKLGWRDTISRWWNSQ
jgi:hypothetical protein